MKKSCASGSSSVCHVGVSKSWCRPVQSRLCPPLFSSSCPSRNFPRFECVPRVVPNSETLGITPANENEQPLERGSFAPAITERAHRAIRPGQAILTRRRRSHSSSWRAVAEEEPDRAATRPGWSTVRARLIEAPATRSLHPRLYSLP